MQENTVLEIYANGKGGVNYTSQLKSAFCTSSRLDIQSRSISIKTCVSFLQIILFTTDLIKIYALHHKAMRGPKVIHSIAEDMIKLKA